MSDENKAGGKTSHMRHTASSKMRGDIDNGQGDGEDGRTSDDSINTTGQKVTASCRSACARPRDREEILPVSSVWHQKLIPQRSSSIDIDGNTKDLPSMTRCQ